MKILITGGAGFIGSNIAKELVNDNQVVILDNLLTGRMENISNIENEIEFIEGDIRDIKTVRAAMVDVDYVLHQAALVSVPRSVNDPVTSNECNVSGTLNVLTAARDQGVKRLVYASSSSVYGDLSGQKREDMTPRPLSPYAVSKLTGEYYCRVFYEVYGLETVSLRYFNVFGPGQDPGSEYSAVIPRFMDLMLGGKRPVVFDDGCQTRDFTYVGDVVCANILAIAAKNAAGGVFNIARGSQTSINALVDRINEILSSDLKPTYTDPRPGDIKHSLADISLAKNILGYNPQHTLKEGLRKTLGWFSQLSEGE